MALGSGPTQCSERTFVLGGCQHGSVTASGFQTFWDDPRARVAIALLADQERLHVFVGAGVSKEAGLPSWTELIDALLQVAAQASDPFRTRRHELETQGIEPAEV